MCLCVDLVDRGVVVIESAREWEEKREREHKERKLVVLECDDVLEMNIRLYYT